MKTDGLLGLEFKHGERDCFSLMRDFYKMNFGLEVPDIARPNEWWEPDAEGKHLNLYMDNFDKWGFGLFHGRPAEYLPGDVILMAIRSPVANHGAILLPGEQILHHLIGQVSCIERFNRPLFRDTTVAVLRHPDVDGAALLQETEIDAYELVPDRIKILIEEGRQGVLDV